MLTKSAAHDAQTIMKTSSTFLTLTVGTLEVMKFKQKVFQIPIIKVWRPNQLGLAEILITILAGSSVWDGGLNRIKPGGKELDQSSNPDIVPDKRNLLEAKRQIFLGYKWAMENYRASNEILRQKSELLRIFQEEDQIKKEIENRAKALLEELDKISDKQKEIHLEVERRMAQIDSDLERLTIL